MSRTDTWMPLYIADYLVDTMRLTTVQHGAYLLLLMEYWRQGPLPDDDLELAAIVKADRKTWTKDISPAVRRFFQRHDDGLLHQKRIDSERQRALDLSDKRRVAGLQRGNKKDTIAPPTVSKEEAIAEQLLTNSLPDASVLLPSLSRDLSPSTKKEEDTGLRPDADASQKPGRDIRDVVWSDGLASVRQITGLPDSRARALLGKLCKSAGDNCAQVQAAITEAVSLRPGDPIAWLTKAVTYEKPDIWAWVDAPVDEKSSASPHDLEMVPDGNGTYDLTR